MDCYSAVYRTHTRWLFTITSVRCYVVATRNGFSHVKKKPNKKKKTNKKTTTTKKPQQKNTTPQTNHKQNTCGLSPVNFHRCSVPRLPCSWARYPVSSVGTKRNLMLLWLQI